MAQSYRGWVPMGAAVAKPLNPVGTPGVIGSSSEEGDIYLLHLRKGAVPPMVLPSWCQLFCQQRLAGLCVSICGQHRGQDLATIGPTPALPLALSSFVLPTHPEIMHS